MIFHVGQKAECIDDGGQVEAAAWFCEKGRIFTVSRVYARSFVGECLEFVELPPPPSWGCFPAKYFRPIVETKTDISIFTEILTPTKAKERA